MKRYLFLLLIAKMEEFIDDPDRSEEGDVCVGENTAEIMARAAEAVYDGMVDSAKLEQENQV